MASAVALAPFDRLLAGRYAVAFGGCLAASFSREIAYVANVPQANFLENAVNAKFGEHGLYEVGRLTAERLADGHVQEVRLGGSAMTDRISS